MMPRDCLLIQVVSSPSTEEMRRAYLAADPRADVVELRLDAVKDLDIDRILSARGKPKLVTMRSRRQGGEAAPADREPVLRRALRAGVEYVDLEFGAEDRTLLDGGGPRPLRRRKTRLVLSFHDFNGTPADLSERCREMMRAAPEGALLKIVTFADASTDNLRVRDLLRGAASSEAPRRLVVFCMGPKGMPSRILASAWGSAAIYAPVRGAASSAPGQIPLEDLCDLYRFDRIGPRTRLLGVLGNPIGHSLSPRMHNTALAALDLDYRYLPFEATTLAEFLPLMSELRVAGLSVTIPYKEKILPYLDSLDPVARDVGAVNTIVKTWNRLCGSNTDVEAAIEPLRRRMPLRDREAAVLGAGGAARALVYGLQREGARVTLFNRTEERARALARELGARHRPWRALRGRRFDILINATSIGMAPAVDATPVPAGWVAAPVVYDIIYNPPETRFLREARRRGATVIDGLEMFVAQGAAQFRLFTGRDAPFDLLRRTVLEALRGVPAGAPAAPGRRPGGRSPAARRTASRAPKRRPRGRPARRRRGVRR
jgi:3-dehydroquinate dehydratase/shikimate dehydrogenase